jgi:hypothetical protein
MKLLLRAFSFCLLACTVRAVEVDDLLDRLDTALTVTTFQDNVRARLSGTIDLRNRQSLQSASHAVFGRTTRVAYLFLRAVAT